MKKYDSKMGITMFLLMAVLCFATILLYIVWAISNVWFPAIAMTFVLLLGYVPIYFFTSYALDTTTLYVRSGYFACKIPLESILAIAPSKNFKPSYSTSYEKIAITFWKNDKTKTVYVSPNLYSTFLNDLTDSTMDNVILTDLHNQKVEAEKEQLKTQVEQKTGTEKQTAVTADVKPAKAPAKKTASTKTATSTKKKSTSTKAPAKKTASTEKPKTAKAPAKKTASKK